MLKPLTQPRASPVSSPNFRYAPASRSLPGSPSTRRDSKSKAQSQPSKPTIRNRVHYVDAGTQWSPIMNLKMEPPPTEPVRIEAPLPPEQPAPAAVPSVVVPAPPSPTKPILQPESPAMKRRQSQDVPTAMVSNTQPLPTKRAKSDQALVKVLPAKYEFCPVEDIVILISNMISELIATNDQLPLRSGVLTRFHSRTPPGISVLDYLQRLAKHATLTPPLLLSMVYYIDRLCLLYPAFTITTLTVHRFLITAATVAAKGLSDSFWNNATYARVGGIKIAELGLLELDFLYRLDWKIVPNPETLVEYYRGLVDRSEGYEIEDEGTTSSSDDDDEEDVESPEEVASSATENTDLQWKAWMNDVSTKRAEASHEDKPA